MRYSAPALEKGLDILELLAAESGGLPQHLIAQRLQRSTSEIFRMLEVLQHRGFLVRGADGHYQLTLRMFELASRHPPTERLLSVAVPRMQALTLQARQSAHLVVHHDRRILVIGQVSSPEPLGFAVRLGSSFPFRPDRASPRVLAAFQLPAQQSALIEEMRSNSTRPLNTRKVRIELDTIREKGFFQAPSDTTLGVTDLCCPVRDGQGTAMAAITMPFLKQRDVPVSLATARGLLIDAAREISAVLAGSVAVRQ